MVFFDRGSKRERYLETHFANIINYLIIIFAIYLISSILYFHPAGILYRGIYVSVMVALVMIYYTPPGEKPNKVRIIDYILSILSLTVGLYIILQADRFIYRVPFFDEIYITDIIAAIVMFTLVLLATQRTIGRPLVIITIVALLYCYFGKYIPGIFGHRGFSLNQVIEQLFMGTRGIYGTPIGISSTYVFMFVSFGCFLSSTGGGNFFHDLSISIAGNSRGGIAKTAVIASSLFGTISGSPGANVLATGSFTIPMMKKAGYPAYFAGAVETAASCGGCITPPVMGSVAFIMATVIGVPYYQVMIAAVFPALLYYFALFYAVDREAIKQNLKGIDKSELPSTWKTLFRGIQYIIPLAWLVYRLLMGFSPGRIAFEAIIFMLLIGFIKKDPKNPPVNINTILDGLKSTVKITLPVSVACAAAGSMIGIINLTGIGGKFASLILGLAHESLFLSLIITMVITLILGMGMTITPSYLIAAALAGPALVRAGVPILPAHLFVVYFAAMATMTPPVCMAAYNAATLAKANPLKVGYTSVRLGIIAYVIPYAFIYRPEILIHGFGLTKIAPTLLMTGFSAMALAAGINRYFLRVNKLWETFLLVIVSIMLLIPLYSYNLFGIALFALVFIYQRK